MKFKRFILCISILCFSLTATGCGEALYTMTDEEEEIIAVYAAKMVSVFNENQTTGVCNVRVKPGELDEAYGVVAEETEVTDDTTVESVDSEGNVTEETVDTDTTEVAGGFSLTEAMGVAGVGFSCASFDVTSEFQATSSFVLTEEKGKKYVVLHITGTNSTDTDIEIKPDFEFKLSVNGSSPASTQYTFMDNDLSSFDGSIPAEGSQDFVLVFLFDNATVDDVSTLELQVTNDGQTRSVTI